jgi:hypothetical protein
MSFIAATVLSMRLEADMRPSNRAGSKLSGSKPSHGHMVQHGRIGAAKHRIPATRDRAESYPPNGGPTDTMLSTIAECLENARQCELVRGAGGRSRRPKIFAS